MTAESQGRRGKFVWFNDPAVVNERKGTRKRKGRGTVSLVNKAEDKIFRITFFNRRRLGDNRFLLRVNILHDRSPLTNEIRYILSFVSVTVFAVTPPLPLPFNLSLGRCFQFGSLSHTILLCFPLR